MTKRETLKRLRAAGWSKPWAERHPGGFYIHEIAGRNAPPAERRCRCRRRGCDSGRAVYEIGVEGSFCRGIYGTGHSWAEALEAAGVKS